MHEVDAIIIYENGNRNDIEQYFMALNNHKLS